MEALLDRIRDAEALAHAEVQEALDGIRRAAGDSLPEDHRPSSCSSQTNEAIRAFRGDAS